MPVARRTSHAACFISAWGIAARLQCGGCAVGGARRAEGDRARLGLPRGVLDPRRCSALHGAGEYPTRILSRTGGLTRGCADPSSAYGTGRATSRFAEGATFRGATAVLGRSRRACVGFPCECVMRRRPTRHASTSRRRSSATPTVRASSSAGPPHPAPHTSVPGLTGLAPRRLHRY